ncbi:MAG: glycerol acyltransferase [Gammaproteobacteria bacterium]|nr:glycerol acyltransferase [Gammaproteobacteria bacterium]
MHFTIHDTPIVIHLMRAIAWLYIKITGWKVDSHAQPKSGNYLIIAAPHTSNWDFPIGLSLALHLHIKTYWIGKNSLFKGPAGPVMRWLGGIPLDRSKANNLVEASIQAYNTNDGLIFAIAPEGTRSWSPRWKTGFYHIANGAQVPLALAYFDYEKKIGGIGKLIQPTGDLTKDMAEIEDFYSHIAAKNPHYYNADIFGTGDTRL